MKDNDTEAGRYPVSFTGSGGEYFKIWIVNILLTILTLYIYSAWAKVRTMRYFKGNTVLDGSSFEYHARPMQILIGRIVAVILFIAVTFSGALHPLAPVVASVILVLVLPWAVWRSTIFNARMTSYRNVRFNFSGSMAGAYLCLLVLPFLPILLAALVAGGMHLSGMGMEAIGGVVFFGILGVYAVVPWVHKRLAEYLADNYHYGRAEFDATLSTGRFYAIYIKAILLSVGILLALLVIIAVVGAAVAAMSGVSMDGLSLEAVMERLSEGDLAGLEGMLVSASVAAYALFFLAGFLVTAYFHSRVRNHLYGNVVIDDRVRMESTVRTWPLVGLKFVNLLLLVFTLGLAWPWVQVRNARFFARNTAVLAPGGLHAVVDDERARQSALGEEVGDAFDMDMDVGF